MITDTYHPTFDGIVRYLDYLIPELVKRKQQITIVCPWVKGEKHSIVSESGLKIVRPFTTNIRTNAYFWALPDWRFIKAIQEAEYVIIHSLMPLGIFGGLLAKLLKKKIAFFSHHNEKIILMKIMHLKPIVVNFIFLLMTKYFKNIVDIFFHATEKFRRKLLALGIPIERIYHVPFAIDLKKFHPGVTKQLHTKYSLPKEAIISSFIGRISIEKNIERILVAMDLAMTDIPHLYSLIIGDGPDYKEMIHYPFKNANRFIFTGFIPEKELQAHYANSDIFVSPTLNESSCFTVFESMACGTPVIIAEKDHDLDIIHLENAILIKNVQNAKEIKEKILLLANDYNLRSKIAHSALNFIETRTWENHANLFLMHLKANYYFKEIMITDLKISKKTEKKNRKWVSRVRKVLG